MCPCSAKPTPSPTPGNTAFPTSYAPTSYAPTPSQDTTDSTFAPTASVTDVQTPLPTFDSTSASTPPVVDVNTPLPTYDFFTYAPTLPLAEGEARNEAPSVEDEATYFPTTHSPTSRP